MVFDFSFVLVLASLVTGLVWAAKILTDPFHDIGLYHRSPLYLLRGELIDPVHHATARPNRGTPRA